MVNEVGIVTKLYFDSNKKKVKQVKLTKKDYEVAFKISAWVLRISSRRPISIGEIGYAKENIVYATKGSIIVILQADREIYDSPYIYGYMKRILESIRSNIDGVIVIDYIEKHLNEMLKNLPKPLKTAEPKHKID